MPRTKFYSLDTNKAHRNYFKKFPKNRLNIFFYSIIHKSTEAYYYYDI